MIKLKTERTIASQLRRLKAFKHWDITSIRGQSVTLHYPKAHKRFAEAYRAKVETFLKKMILLNPNSAVHLMPK